MIEYFFSSPIPRANTRPPLSIGNSAAARLPSGHSTRVSTDAHRSSNHNAQQKERTVSPACRSILSSATTAGVRFILPYALIPKIPHASFPLPFGHFCSESQNRWRLLAKERLAFQRVFLTHISPRASSLEPVKGSMQNGKKRANSCSSKKDARTKQKGFVTEGSV